MNQKISILWWNTSLSSTANQAIEPSDEKRNVVVEVLKSILIKNEIVVLCEISSKDIEYFKKKINFNSFNFNIINGTQAVGRTRFDTCLIYKKELLVSSEAPILKIAQKGKQKFKIAQQYQLKISNKDIHLYVCHWPSRLRDSTTDRKFIADNLRLTLEKSAQEDLFIIAGDFNCDPFDSEITDGLLASPEKQLTLKNRGLIYNPCWKFLSEQQHQPLADLKHHGTHHYKKSVKSRCWYTFDQILFSSSFLKQKGWTLDEESVAILSWCDILDADISVGHKFDHLPVVATIVEKK